MSHDERAYPRRPDPPDPEWLRHHACDVTDLGRLLDAHAVDRAVLVQAMGAYADDNRYCVDAAATDPDRLAAVVYVRSASALDALAHRGIAGVRVVGGDGSGHPRFDDPVIAELLSVAAGAGLRVVATAVAAGLPQLPAALSAWPGVPVVVDHCGFVDVTGGPAFPNTGPLTDLAAFPAVHVKVTTNVLDLCRAADVDPRAFVEHVAGAFGAGRLHWGSDWSHTHDRPYGALVEEARRCFASLGPAGAALALGGAADAFWFS